MLALVSLHGEVSVEIFFYVDGITLNLVADLITWEEKADRVWNMLAKEFGIE